jgi:hypothetical protein
VVFHGKRWRNAARTGGRGFKALFKAIILFIATVGKWDCEKNGSWRTTLLFREKEDCEKRRSFHGPNIYFLPQDLWNIENWENKALFSAPAHWKFISVSLNIDTETITLALLNMSLGINNVRSP